MQNQHGHWDEEHLIHTLKHYLPAQAPLKDFVHHNTLHAFQEEPFFEALNRASHMLGYKTSLSLKAFRRKYSAGEISDDVINSVISEDKGLESLASWRYNMLEEAFDHTVRPQVGKLRAKTKELYQLDMDAQVHTRLFRLLGAYLDQGVSIQPFPITDGDFLSAIREMENKSKVSFFKSNKVKILASRKGLTMTKLLDILVGDPKLYASYVFDQQFAHPGWSGMVSFVEDHPNALLAKRRIKIEELIILELLFEIDVLETKFGHQWKALGQFEHTKPADLFSKPPKSEYTAVMILWQKAMEESFYSQVLNTLTFPLSVR